VHTGGGSCASVASDASADSTASESETTERGNTTSNTPEMGNPRSSHDPPRAASPITTSSGTVWRAYVMNTRSEDKGV